jgi:hypothetical protein
MENAPINFRFVAIQTISKSMAQSPEPPIDLSLTSFNITVETRVHAQSRLVMPYVHLKVNRTDTKMELASLTVAYYFEIEEFDKFILLNEDKLYLIPPHLDALIRPVCISTTRGVFYSEFRGTYLHNCIMPVVFMDAFTEIKNAPPLVTENIAAN